VHDRFPPQTADKRGQPQQQLNARSVPAPSSNQRPAQAVVEG
jgi:hypothetical protein